MARGPRYVPKLYGHGSDAHWRVFDTWMRLPLTAQYSSRERAAANAATRNEFNEKGGQSGK
jgi:RNAse (barnase) inhibitor barstar